MVGFALFVFAVVRGRVLAIFVAVVMLLRSSADAMPLEFRVRMVTWKSVIRMRLVEMVGASGD